MKQPTLKDVCRWFSEGGPQKAELAAIQVELAQKAEEINVLVERLGRLLQEPSVQCKDHHQMGLPLNEPKEFRVDEQERPISPPGAVA